MINSIIRTFYNISREHVLVRQFKYDRLSKGSGIGEENHPLVFLEDPIYVGDSTLSDGSVRCTVNFDVVMTPQAFENWNKRQLTPEECQTVAHSIALNFVAKLKDINHNYEEYDEDEYNTSIRVVSYSFMTLRNWYDNNAAGVRCTMIITVDNPIDYCDLDEHFNPEKEFDMGELLQPIDTDEAYGCVTFDYKLPKINFD
jgi:hypothetical protein